MRYAIGEVILILAFASIVGCNKENVNNAYFSIISPEVQSYYVGGDTIRIIGSVVGDSELYGLSVQLLNDANDSILFTYSNEEHLTSYNFNQFYVNQVAEHMDVRLEVVAELDHEGNEAKKTMLLHLYP
jgi:hypothetical protein